ncbi:hypothetical protein ONZ51_g13024 [Trametes cubensis]|uniref:Uncharacterized protein n=1 Tax=Trametes cubensis TaxID=1111947 RepID=A0AAD7X467_9APHY|nr:hypothetical protein ONZ51_g13024 [Trametes cubensis]
MGNGLEDVTAVNRWFGVWPVAYTREWKSRSIEQTGGVYLAAWLIYTMRGDDDLELSQRMLGLGATFKLNLFKSFTKVEAKFKWRHAAGAWQAQATVEDQVTLLIDNATNGPLLGWGSLLVAAGVSYYYARKSINERRALQEARGQRPSEKLDWRERIVREEKKLASGNAAAPSATSTAVEGRSSEKGPS